MKNRKLTVTIGIPAFNEENNIGNLIGSILSGDQAGYKLEKIIVVSDGGSDNTVNIVKSILDKRVFVIEGNRRIGKPGRINQIFDKAQSDIVVILDADIKINSKLFIWNLIKPMVLDNIVQLTSGKSIPLQPITIAEKIAYSGIELWNEARNSTPKASLYHCEGTNRAFRRELYKKIIFPMASADDVYPFLYCMENNFKFSVPEDAKVYYRLPTTISDYIKQITRALRSENIQAQNFNKDVVKKYYTITFKIKIKTLLKRLLKDPFWTIAYVIILAIPKILNFIDESQDNGIWEIVLSTKPQR